MGELNVSVVAVDRLLWTGTATVVSARTLEGEIGILPRHEPVLALLAEGPVRITTTAGEELRVAVHGGFFAVDDDNVSILADTAELSSEIDVARAKAALERASSEPGSTSDDDHLRGARARAEVRLAVADAAP